MDGENAWEYYEDNGRSFFETLYANLDRQGQLYSTTVSEYIETAPPEKTISNIFPGSWINHDFGVWIGDEQDNLSWEYLRRARKTVSTAQMSSLPMTCRCRGFPSKSRCQAR